MHSLSHICPKYYLAAQPLNLTTPRYCLALQPPTLHILSMPIDEPAHLVQMCTILFLHLYHFLSIADTPTKRHTCATSCTTSMSLHAHSLTQLALVCPINPSHHWTGFTYGTYRWPMDLIVMFSFLDWSPCCFSDDHFIFLTYWSATMICNSSSQLPDSPRHRPTGPKSLHRMVSESGDCCHFAANDPCSCFSLDKSFVFNCL